MKMGLLNGHDQTGRKDLGTSLLDASREELDLAEAEAQALEDESCKMDDEEATVHHELEMLDRDR
ncbi:hypothetical protein N0V93_010278 [Gnomoniopsis smithogilvyi]|uniref:Uncharacterized protein n=1 Tax=Gnomoniopsis smithogilvyi TaxID=1191159 RepID=A0A9W9CSJ8_9PEZI|nr:hypothetical protein N0V93_010278 [Gnomoniopsis smithogilvyi]